MLDQGDSPVPGWDRDPPSCVASFVGVERIQSAAEIASVPDTAYANINRLMGEVLKFISGESGLMTGNA